MTMGTVAAIATIAGTAYGGYSANRNRQRAKDQMKADRKRQEELLQEFMPAGKEMLGQGRENINFVQDYLRRLGSGDRGLTQQTLAPELNAMGDQARGAVAAQRGLAPRGGMGAAAAADIPRQFQANTNNLMFAARPQAMDKLAQLGGNQASLGLSAMGQGAGLTNSMLQFGLDARRQSMAEGAATGEGIINGLLTAYSLYNNRGGGGGSGLSPWMANQQQSRPPSSGYGLLGNQQSPYANQGIYSIPGSNK